jgi:Ca2+-binding RTX toxin-like protein
MDHRISKIVSSDDNIAAEKIPYAVTEIEAVNLISGKLTELTRDSKEIVNSNISSRQKLKDNETLRARFSRKKANSSSITEGTSRSAKPVYKLTSSAEEVTEGKLVTFSLQTRNVAIGTRLNYTIFGSRVKSSDFLQPLTGAFVVGANGLATAQVKINADFNTEGFEKFTLRLNNNQARATVKIKDTSTKPVPTITKISRVFSTINEGSTARFIVHTANFAANTNLTYRIVGLNSTDVLGGGLTGVVIIRANGKGVIDVPITEDEAEEGAEFINVIINYVQNGVRRTIQSATLTGIVDTSVRNVFGTAINDTLTGSRFRDLMWGEDGDDLLSGGAGNDQLVGSQGGDKLRGGAGNDLLVGNEGADTLEGGEGDDFLYLGDNNLVADIDAAEGEEAVGGEGNDVIVGTNPRNIDRSTWPSYSFYGDSKDWKSTTGGNDVIWGSAGFGLIDGGGGNDELRGYLAFDGNLSGGHGDDVLYAGNMHGVSGGPGHDRACLLGNLSDYSFERQSDEGNIGLGFRTSKYVRADGSPFYYFLSDVEEFVMADGIVRNTAQFIKDQGILWPWGLTASRDISSTLSSTNQSIIPGIPAISFNKAFGTPNIKKAISKNLLEIGNSRIGAKIAANLSVDAKLEAYMQGSFSLGSIDTIIPVKGSMIAAREYTEISVYSQFELPDSASYRVKEPSAFFKAGLRGHLQANASLDLDAWANIPAVTVPKPWGGHVEITPSVDLKIDERLGLPSNLTKRFNIEQLMGGPFVNIDALRKPSYTYTFPNGSITAEVPLISFSKSGKGSYLSGSGSDPFLKLNFDVASFIAERLPIPLSYTFDRSFKTPSILGYRAEAGVFAKASVLKADLISKASLVEEITVSFKGFRADFTVEGQTGPQDQLLYGGSSFKFSGGVDRNGDGLLSVAATLEPVVEITNRTYVDLDIDLGVALPNLEYKAWANVGGTGDSIKGSWSAVSQKFDLFNADIALFTKTWELGGFSSRQVNFGAI